MENKSWSRTLAAALLMGATLAACAEQSRVDPNADIRVSGAVVMPDGAPLASRPVKMGAGITEGEVGYAILTVGLSCQAGNCRGARLDSSTDDQGQYAFQLKGADTQSSFGEAVSELVTTSAAPVEGHVSGPAVAARFKIQTEDVRLPTLKLVDPGLKLEGDTDVKATWTAAASGPYTLSFETADPVAAWKTMAAGTEAIVDPRLLEDTAGRAVVAGELRDAIEGSDVSILWRSPGIGYAAGAGAPPSRGRPCRYVFSGGATSPPVNRCELTDGDLADDASSTASCPAGDTTSTTSCGSETAAIVDLGQPVPAELVVVRGCEGGCAVEISTDGSNFAPVGSVSDDFGQLALDGRPVTAVKVGLGAQDRLREISVWGPRPAAPALKPLSTGTSDDLRSDFGVKETDKGLSRWLLVVAAGLALLALVGAAYAIGRRRGPATTA